MNIWKKATLIVFATLVLLALFTATVLPIFVRNKAVEVLREATGRDVRIEKISLNPLTLTASVRGFAIEESGGGPFLAVGTLRISISPASLYRRALVLSEVAVDSPSLRIVRNSSDRFNFTDITERQKKEEKPKPAGLFPFVLYNFKLTNGSLDLDDRAVAGNRKHSVRELEISLPWLSSLPAEAERAAEPRISLVINGAPLTLTGKLKPFGKDLDSSVRVGLQNLSLPELAVYVPQAPPVNLSSGTLTCSLDVLFRRPGEGKPELSVKGLTRLDSLDINMGKGQPLLKLPLLEIKAANLEPLAGRFDFEEITLDGLELFVQRDRRGKWMVQKLLAPNLVDEQPTPAATTAKLLEGKKIPEILPAGMPSAVPMSPRKDKGDKAPSPQISVASLALQNGYVHFRDDFPKGGFKTSVEEIVLSVKDVSNQPAQTGQFDLSLRVDQETRLASHGSFTLADPSVKTVIQLTGLSLQKGWPYLAEYLTSPIQGIVDLSGEVTFDSEDGLGVERGSLALKNLSVRYGSQEGLDLKRLAIDGAAFHQNANRVEIDQLQLSQGTASLSLDADGKPSILKLLVPRGENPAKEESVPPPSGKLYRLSRKHPNLSPID